MLTGLPPEPARLRRFLADKRADGYGRLVDDLLASPRFGEHQARNWLDAVRYGDTHGLHLDDRRGIYPYRDWVVRAFNENLPLDKFISWQLAGDLTPNPSLAQLVATGYVRLKPRSAEGGANPVEFQAKNTFDRTETLGTVMLGTMMTCARCHTHKYDPISHREYYGLFAFFNSTAESPLDGNRYAYAPVVRAPANQRVWQEWSELEPDMGSFESKWEKCVDMNAVRKHASSAARFRASDWRVSRALALGAGVPAELPKAKRLPGVMPKLVLKRGEVAFVSFKVDADVEQTVWIGHSGGPGSTVATTSGPGRPTVGAQGSITHPSVSIVDDPENRFLARGPGRRLDAEAIRDVALWASGLLDPTMGGEGAKPLQPLRVLEADESAPGDDVVRRAESRIGLCAPFEDEHAAAIVRPVQ